MNVMIVLYVYTHVLDSYSVVTRSTAEQDVKNLHIEVGTIWNFKQLCMYTLCMFLFVEYAY